MTRDARHTAGRAAERAAERFLRQQGLVFIKRNFRTRHGEIDLVMRDRRCVVFVEVRTRGGRRFVDAHLTVDFRKQQKLCRAAQLFLKKYPQYSQLPCRFDVIGIDNDPDGTAGINWLTDAFRPSS